MRAFAAAAAVALAALLAAASSRGAGRAEAARAVDFAREVRPILAQHCYFCHGPDEKARKARLRLDRKADALAERDGSFAIAPGRPDDSELVFRVAAEDPKRRMPPPAHEAEPLAPAEIEVLRRWIEEGANWPEHWAFAAPARSAPPLVADASWPVDPLDAFVLARLEREGLAPAPPAAKEAWLRRVTFDLTGLPPAQDELDAFLKDDGPDARAKQVDRLLASPRYGERQASIWLDLARYADSGGYQRDQGRTAWKWREWVVNAFNQNVPYDRFTIEQLAGDLLPNATLEQRVATGFNRNHPTNSEAGEEEDEYRSAYVIDRVNTTATTWMGLTLGCAQCHDHKYDPLSQKDFYRFYAFFNNVAERDSDGFGSRNPRPSIPVPSADQAPRLADLDRRIAALERRLEAEDPLADEEQRAWETAARERLGAPPSWTTLEPFGMLSQNGSLLQVQPDGSILATGPIPVRDTYDLVLKPGKVRIAALRIEVLPDASQPMQTSGRADDGRFILSRLEVKNSSLSESQDPPLVHFVKAEQDLNQKSDPEALDFDFLKDQPSPIDTALAVDDADAGGFGGFGGDGGGWCISGDAKKERHEAILLPLEPLDLNDASVLRVSLQHTSQAKFKSLIGRFRLSFTEDERVRRLYLPVAPKTWSLVGPFPADDVVAAFETEFEPEQQVKAGVDLALRYVQPEVAEEPSDKPAPGAAPPPAAPAPPAAAEAAAKPVAADENGDKRKAEAAKEAKPDEKKAEEKKKPEKLAWTEQPKWRDGKAARLEGKNAAFYLARSLASDGARTAVLELDGPAGLRVWVNGEVAYTAAPAPPPAPRKPKGEAGKATAAKPKPEAEPDFSMMREPKPPAHTVRVGLRDGTNEIVVKAVFGAPQEEPRGKGGGGGMGGAPGGPGDRGSKAGGSFKFAFRAEGEDLLDHEVATALRASAAEPADDGRAARAKVMRTFFRTRISAVGRVLFDELEQLKTERKALKREIPEALVMDERAEPRQAYVFKRGHYKNKGEPVDAGVPEALPPLPEGAPRNRLGLAQWLVSRDHPLTARVLVNRVWQQYFGAGLVRTGDDFGIRSEPPSHPELLDTLAVEFMESGWDLKQLHRRIALSATYAQSAALDPAKVERDPENRLLARGPRQRLAAEMIRDSALSLSGLLVEKIGGPSVKPFQPDGLWKEIAGSRDYVRDEGEDQYRRALYVYWKRGAPYPSLLTFDAAKRETCTVARPITNTPLQALVLLNDPVFVECARAFGQRILKQGGKDDAARLAFGYRLATSRRAGEAELAVLSKLLAEQRAHYQANAEAAKLLLAVGDAPGDEKVEPVERAAWTAVGSALLNLDATLNKG